MWGEAPGVHEFTSPWRLRRGRLRCGAGICHSNRVGRDDRQSVWKLEVYMLWAVEFRFRRRRQLGALCRIRFDSSANWSGCVSKARFAWSCQTFLLYFEVSHVNVYRNKYINCFQIYHLTTCKAKRAPIHFQRSGGPNVEWVSLWPGRLEVQLAEIGASVKHVLNNLAVVSAIPSRAAVSSISPEKHLSWK